MTTRDPLTTLPALVLNVNDHDGARFMVTRMLKLAGFRVIEASSGTSALNEVRRQLPDIVVLDVRLPDLDGLEVCKRIKADPNTSFVKVLHTSATFVTSEYRAKGLDVGADAYLTQPFQKEELVATIRSLLRSTATETHLRKRAQQLEDSERRKDEFLAMLGHELRNPLAAIGSAFAIVDGRTPVNPMETKARDVIRRQFRHLTRLVDDLLDVARVTQGKIQLKNEPVNLSELLERVVIMAREAVTAPRSQLIDLTLPRRPVFVRGDVTRLEQVFTNLIDNASKYSDPRAAIDVELSHVTDKFGGRAKVLVRDAGIGIEADALPQIFDLFAQSNVTIARSRGGLGIGLTIVKTLVELHGGTVSVRSEGAGLGSEFDVTLPTLAEESKLPESPEAVTSDKAIPRRRILLVEDNLDAQEMFKMLCESWGHEVLVASDGLTGVEHAIRGNPDICFIDIGIPEIDGFEVARRVRRDPQGAELLLIALTGYGTSEVVAKARASGFDVHMTKPLDVDRLESLLREKRATIRAG